MADWLSRAAAIEPVRLKAPVFGSYNSAEAISATSASTPPAMRTRPSESAVADWLSRTVVIEPVALKVPVFGS